jgi:hypothetical protein
MQDIINKLILDLMSKNHHGLLDRKKAGKRKKNASKRKKNLKVIKNKKY